MDLLGAQQNGENAYSLHVKKLEKGVGFYEPILKLKVKTFSNPRKAASSKATSKEIVFESRQQTFWTHAPYCPNQETLRVRGIMLPPWFKAVVTGQWRRNSQEN